MTVEKAVKTIHFKEISIINNIFRTLCVNEVINDGENRFAKSCLAFFLTPYFFLHIYLFIFIEDKTYPTNKPVKI